MHRAWMQAGQLLCLCILLAAFLLPGQIPESHSNLKPGKRQFGVGEERIMFNRYFWIALLAIYMPQSILAEPFDIRFTYHGKMQPIAEPANNAEVIFEDSFEQAFNLSHTSTERTLDSVSGGNFFPICSNSDSNFSTGFWASSVACSETAFTSSNIPAAGSYSSYTFSGVMYANGGGYADGQGEYGFARGSAKFSTRFTVGEPVSFSWGYNGVETLEKYGDNFGLPHVSFELDHNGLPIFTHSGTGEYSGTDVFGPGTYELMATTSGSNNSGCDEVGPSCSYNWRADLDFYLTLEPSSLTWNGSTITHSRDQTIMPFNSESCDDGIRSANSSYLRTFKLTDFGIDKSFEVTEIKVGIESSTLAGTATVNLYILDGPFVFNNLTLIGSTEFPVPEVSPNEGPLFLMT